MDAKFLAAYIECALWSSTAYGSSEELEAREAGRQDSFDKSFESCNYDASDLSEELLKQVTEDCENFMRDNASDLAGLDAAQCGHDFWLTRNRHGAGFWDRAVSEKSGAGSRRRPTPTVLQTGISATTDRSTRSSGGHMAIERFYVTYDVVTPESARHGDAAERGWSAPGGWKFDDRPAPITLRAALDIMGASRARSGGYGFELSDGPSYYYGGEGDIDYRTGAETSYALHVDRSVSQASQARIGRLLARR